MKYPHYFKSVEGLTHVDVYRVLVLFGVTDPCLQHAIKKLLVAGGRGSKNMPHDIQEAIDALARWQAMRVEDEREKAEPTKIVACSCPPGLSCRGPMPGEYCARGFAAQAAGVSVANA